MSEQITDQQLVERVQQGDKNAFNLLVTRLVNLAGTTGGQCYKPAADHFDLLSFAVPYIHPFTALGVLLTFDHIDGIVTLKNMNVGVLGYRFVKGDLQRFASGIGGMQDAAEAMPAFSSQMIAVFTTV